MAQEDFFSRFNIDPLAFDRSGLRWSTLEDIARSYETIKPELHTLGRYVVDSLLKCTKVHSLNYRIKETDHLLEKIIRKTIADPSRNITPENVTQEVTDLIGIRALHLFKEDWINIHEYLQKHWNFAEAPTAYYRHGDSPRILDYYTEKQCRIQEHPHGYRSVHYLVESNPGKGRYIAEIQVRTIFEEAWGEIDHVVRYPYYTDNDMLVRLSSILNRLSADADELGTYMRYLKNQTETTERLHSRELADKNRIIDTLRRQINELSIDTKEKTRITGSLDELEQHRPPEPPRSSDHPWLDSFIDSPLFRTLSSRIDQIVRSEQFPPIEISPEEQQLVENAGSELFKILGDPQTVKRLLENPQTRSLIEQYHPQDPDQDRDQNSDGD
ncbi:RelA/SpoT domain-containing protein [Spirochaeta lutea]|uniref:RelA/SpoT domain-containing protein n=1 Tax=Spirochaeta lutea TaxID=1480694 RepID=UPI00068BFB22|nr:hypothetical protein [Spirochaeta lutea]